MKAVNRNPTAAELVTFGRVMWGGFAVMGALLWYASVRTPGAWWPQGEWGWQANARQIAAVGLWSLGPLLWGIGSFAPKLARPIYVGWMTAAGYMGLVSSFILLAALYFIALPVFSLLRLADPLRLSLRPSGSYWEKTTPHDATLERMARPF
jgi:hypothetical protein